MTTAVIYSNSNQECERMGMLLRSVSTEFHEYVLGNHFTQQQFQMEFAFCIFHMHTFADAKAWAKIPQQTTLSAKTV